MVNSNFNIKKSCSNGLTLAEILISIVIISFVLFGSYMVMSKSNLTATSLSDRNRLILDVEPMLQILRKKVNASTKLDSASYNRKIKLYVRDANYNYTTVIYRISTMSGKDRLEISDDNGSTWRSPYPMSDTTRYTFSGEFLFCGPLNNCTRFIDTNGNGVYESGVDAAPALAVGFSGTPLTDPAKANKVLLKSFAFDRELGTPRAQKQYPNIFFRMEKMKVWSQPLLLQSFSTNSANLNFNTSLQVRDIEWDAREQRLLIVGRSVGLIYETNREGVFMDPTFNPGISSAGFESIAFENYNGFANAYLLDKVNQKLYIYDLYNNSVDYTYNTNTYITTPTAVAWDSAYPDDFYILGKVSGVTKVLKRDKWSGNASGNGTNSYTLPGALTNPGGMAMDQVNQAFYVADNTVSGSGASRTILIYRIDPSNPTAVDTMTINIADLGSSATSATTNYFGLAYDLDNNRLFISDLYSNKIYEVIPARMMTDNSGGA